MFSMKLTILMAGSVELQSSLFFEATTSHQDVSVYLVSNTKLDVKQR